MKWFAEARDAPTSRHVGATLAQTAVFWGVFLVLLPWLVLTLERAAGVPPMSLPAHRWLGGALFVAASVLGLTTGLLMAVRGRGTPLPLLAARQLVTTGPYRFVRNPMAVAGISQGVAVGLWLDSAAVVLYALAGAVLWHLTARRAEERDLAVRFGAAFNEYRERVPLWLPRLRPRSGERSPRDGRRERDELGP